MSTWSARPTARGIATPRWGRLPTPPPVYTSPNTSSRSPSPPSSIPSTPSTTMQSWGSPDPDTGPPHAQSVRQSDVQDWLENQLAATGEMSVLERLHYLLNSGQFSDVNIRVGKGSEATVFKAHRLLLATASQSLYKLVYAVNPHPGPNDITTIRVTDMKPQDFESILKYIYTDSIDCKNISVAFELLRASKKWGLAGMGIKSLNYLEEFLDDFQPSSETSNTNLFDLLVLSAETLNDIYEKCWQILIQFANEVIPCEGFLNLEKEMASKVINHKDLRFKNNLKLFEAIRDWGLRYIEKKGLKMTQLVDVVEGLLNAVDFDKISDSDFVNTVLTSECLGKAEVIAFFMTHGLEIPRNLDFNNNKQLPFWVWFFATSDTTGKAKKGLHSSSSSSSFGSSSSRSGRKLPKDHLLSSVAEICPKISFTQNGSVQEFNKVCRFRKGYKCPQKEIYQSHELRFRVDKNIKLLGIGFGFLFSCIDMGVTIHCQGPWETRQWTDLIQTYCRVSGEKQETADVRLMFSEPVRIQADQSYKVMVKIGRMSAGTSEVDLWGGTGGKYSVETEDAEFFFIKAAVDPKKDVEEGDGDINPGVITELLYRLDTDEKPAETIPRRRRPPAQQEEEDEEIQEQQVSNPWRRQHKPVETSINRRVYTNEPEMTLKVPETPNIRKRSPPSNDLKPPEVPPLTRRRESSNDTSSMLSYGRKSPVEEYKPTSFSTNRWRTRKRDDETDSKQSLDTSSSYGSKSTTEEYKPLSFSTNRWQAKPKEEDTSSRKTTTDEYKPQSFSTNRWRSRPKEEDKDIKKDSLPYGGSRRTSTEENKPQSFTTSNRWRTKVQEEEKNIKSSLSDSPYGSSRKTSVEDHKPESFSTNRWRTRSSREEAPGTNYGTSQSLLASKDDKDAASSSHLYTRRRESAESKATDVPPYLRKRSTEEHKLPKSTISSSRWGTAATPSTDERQSRDSTTRSRYSTRDGDDSGITSRRPSDSSGLKARDLSSSRYGNSRDSPMTSVRDSSLSRVRDPSLTRMRESSASRYGGSGLGSSSSSYSRSRYSSPTPSAGKLDSGSSGISSRYGPSSTSRSKKVSSGFESPAEYCASLSNVSNRYGTSTSAKPKESGISSRYSSSELSRKPDSDSSGISRRHGSPVLSSRLPDTSSRGITSRYGLSSDTAGSSDKNDLSSSRYRRKYGSTSSTSRSDCKLDSLPSAPAESTTSEYGGRYSRRYGSTPLTSRSACKLDSLTSTTVGPESSPSKHGDSDRFSRRYGSTTAAPTGSGCRIKSLASESSLEGSAGGINKYGSTSTPGRGSPTSSSRFASSSGKKVSGGLDDTDGDKSSTSRISSRSSRWDSTSGRRSTGKENRDTSNTCSTTSKNSSNRKHASTTVGNRWGTNISSDTSNRWNPSAK